MKIPGRFENLSSDLERALVGGPGRDVVPLAGVIGLRQAQEA